MAHKCPKWLKWLIKHIRVGKKVKSPFKTNLRGFSASWKLVALLLPLIIGCARGSGSVTIEPKKISWTGNRPQYLKYKDNEVEVEIDNRGKPLVTLGDLPKVEFDK